MALRAVVYMRKSSSDKDENHQKYSLERQLWEIERYFANQEIIAKGDPTKKIIWNKELGVDWFREDASSKVPADTKISGKYKRPEFLKMLKEINKGKFDILLCADLSRLSRNAVDTGRIVQLLEPLTPKKDETIPLKQIRTTDKVFYNTATDKFTLSLFMSVAKFENDQRAKNTSSGMKRTRLAGGTTGKAPIGYKNRGNTKNNKWVEADENNFKKCRLLWEMLLSEKYSFADIYRKKNELNIQHFYKKKWRVISNAQVRTMFSNHYYEGKIPKNSKEDDEWIKGNHPEMVTKEEFLQAQMILQRMGRTHAKIEKTVKLGELISSIAISPNQIYIQANNKKRPASFSYEERTRYYCCSCKKRFFDNSNPTECRYCGKSFDENTRTKTDKRFTPIINKKVNGKIVPGKTAKGSSFTLDSILQKLKEEFDKLVITDEFFQVCKNRLFTLWTRDEKEYQKSAQELLKKEQNLTKEGGNLRRKILSDELIT